MAPMITDSYLNYNDSDFGNSNQTGKYYNSTSNKPPLPSLSYSMSDQQSLNGFNYGIRRAYTEDSITEILKGNNYKQQYELFDELILQSQGNIDSLLNYKNLDEFYVSLGQLLINTISNEVQRSCLKFLQIYFKAIDKLKQRRKNDTKLNDKFKHIDSKLSNIFLEYLIVSSVSNKLQLKQISIDLIYTYMKITDDLNENCFNKFIKYGIENTDLTIARQFMDPTLCILLTDEFQDFDFSQLVKSLIKQSSNPKYESSALKCLNKIETIVKKDEFNSYLNKLPQNLKTSYLNTKNANTTQFKTVSSNDTDTNNSEENMKFNIISARTLQKLSGEDEIQRLQAINQLEANIRNLKDIKTVYPYYQDFIVYMTNFVDDQNYEIRLGSIKTISLFIEKLGSNVNQCYKAICTCARNVMTQTHQSKTIKQSLTSMILISIENMSAPILMLEMLLEKIKDRTAKAREEFLNIIIAAVLKFPSDKYDSLRKIFFQVAPLLYDIKRNVRHAALECIAVIFNRLKQIDRNAGTVLDQLEHVPDFQNLENLQLIRDVIIYRLNRNKIAVLNSDMTLEYGVKIPSSGTMYSNGTDLDIEWIISASSSASASNVSSARSQKSFFNDSNQNMTTSNQTSSNTNSNNNANSNTNNNRMINLNNSNAPISTGSFRRPSGSKRMPWDEMSDVNSQNQSIPKVMRSREVAPLKAFPLNDDADIINPNISINNNYSINNLNNNNILNINNNITNNNSNNNFNNTSTNSNSKIGYPSTTSYQEKYLKKIQSDQNKFYQSKTDSQLDISDITNTAKKLQDEKAYSLDNLYNFDESINSDINVQKRKYANLNLKNGIIPSKPIIPRRNSANKYTNDLDSANNSFLSTNRTNFETDLDTTNSQYSGEEYNNKFGNTDRDGNESNRNKFDTVPNIRNSAKNRKKLEKIFSIGSNTGLNGAAPPNSNANLFENSNIRSNKMNLNKEDNLYLSKLKAEKYHNDMNTSRYSPSNPESGIFSLSDYEQSENRFIKMQQIYNNQDSKKSTSNQSNNRDINNNITQSNNNSKQTNNLEYNPLAGVSFKQTHSSDVEIVGVKLGNQSNHDINGLNNNNSNNNKDNQNIGIKKKNSLRNLNDNNFMSNEHEMPNNDMLDVVGKGYYSNYETSFIQESLEKNDFSNNNNNNNNTTSNNPDDFPLSLSFRSRLRQKTQEKIEEKQKKRVEKLKATKKNELENLNSSISGNQSPPPQSLPIQNDYEGYKSDKNFGLSISSYSNQSSSNVNSKPPIYNQNSDQQQIYPLDDYSDNINNKKLNKSNSNNGYDYPSEYPDEQFESNSTTLPSLEKPKFQPTKATQARLKAKAAAAAQAANPVSSTPPDIQNTQSEILQENETEIVYRIVKEDYVKQPFKNPENALKEAMNYLSQENWENKCHAMNIIRRLSVYHEDLAVNNIHAIVLALVQEVKNLRSQVSRFALMTFGDLFITLKKYMDVDLDIAVKTILQKNSETNEFIRVDIEKCLEKMINNVTTHKAIVALINGGASHRNPLIRRTTAQYVYKCCEIMGPGKILSGIKDVTERILVTASQFVVDGPVDIRWYGRKIFHMLMSHDEFDRMLVKYLNEKNRKNIKEILDTVRVKGPGDVPTESARNSRKGARNGSDLISRSAGSNSNSNSGIINQRSDLFGTSEPGSNSSTARPYNHPPLPPTLRLDSQSQEYLKSLCAQLRNPDFRERIDAVEKFQVLCETETNMAVANLVQIFDKFNPCLTDSNSKVNYKALSTMYQITPILVDDLGPVINNVVPLIAQNLASKNSEIQDMASNILDVFVEYLDGSCLIQPFANIAQHGNVRIKPQIIFKLADLVTHVYSRKQKQIELHVLPTVWALLNSVKGTSTSGANILNTSITKLVQNLYEQMGDQLIERASNSSAVSARNLEILKELIINPLD